MRTALAIWLWVLLLLLLSLLGAAAQRETRVGSAAFDSFIDTVWQPSALCIDAAPAFCTVSLGGLVSIEFDWRS